MRAHRVTDRELRKLREKICRLALKAYKAEQIPYYVRLSKALDIIPHAA